MDGLPPVAHLVIWLSVAALAATAWLARRASQGAGLPRAWGRFGSLLTHASTPALQCRETIRLTPQHTLHLVEWEGRRLLIACHPAGATALPEASPAAALPERRAASA